MDQQGEYISSGIENGVATLTLNRPPLNVLNIRMLGELNHELERLRDSAIRLLIVRGNGKAFCAGVDVAEHLPETARDMLGSFHRTFDLLAEIEAPTLAIVQ